MACDICGKDGCNTYLADVLRRGSGLVIRPGEAWAPPPEIPPDPFPNGEPSTPADHIEAVQAAEVIDRV